MNAAGRSAVPTFSKRDIILSAVFVMAAVALTAVFIMDVEGTDAETDGLVCEITGDAPDMTATIRYSGEGSDFMKDYTAKKKATWNVAGVKHIVLEEGVRSIGAYAFYQMTGVTDVSLPNSLGFISTDAFNGCSGIRTMVFPDSLSSIYSYSFKGCTSLESVVFPSSDDLVVFDHAFMNCTSLKNAVFTEGITSMEEGVFYGCTKLESVVLPDSIECIWAEAFRGCSALKEITIPEKVRIIKERAFSGCTSMERINYNAVSCNDFAAGNDTFWNVGRDTPSLMLFFGDNVTKIPAYMFDVTNREKIASLGFISIGKGVTSVGSNAFAGCIGLTSVSFLGSKVTAIGDHAFAECNYLNSIDFPEVLQTIGEGAFESCLRLSEVSIPSSVTSIGNGAFRSCMMLSEIVYDVPNHAAFGTGVDNPFEEAGLSSGYIEVTFGDNVISIPENMFSGTMLPDFWIVTVSSSVTSIGSNAFSALPEDANFGFAPGPSDISVGANAFGMDIYDMDGTTRLVEKSTSCAVSSLRGFMFSPDSGRLMKLYVTLDPQGGSVPSTKAVTDYQGRLAQIPTAENHGRILKGWYTEAEGGVLIDTYTEFIGFDTIYARWGDLYTIAFDMNGHGTAPEKQELTPGSKAVRPEDPKCDGYLFRGWYREKECINPWDFDAAPTSDSVIYAKWISGTLVKEVNKGDKVVMGLEIDISRFQKISVDGTVLPNDGTCYLLNDHGNIEVEFTKKYISSLALGSHTVVIYTSESNNEGIITVSIDDHAEFNWVPWAAIGGSIGIVILAIAIGSLAARKEN